MLHDSTTDMRREQNHTVHLCSENREDLAALQPTRSGYYGMSECLSWLRYQRWSTGASGWFKAPEYCLAAIVHREILVAHHRRPRIQ